MKNLNKLREQCLVLKAKSKYAKHGSLPILAKKLNINKNQLSMALTGYRNTAGSESILKALKSELKTGQGA